MGGRRRPAARKRRLTSSTARIERDSLGEAAVPLDALYGIRTARAIAKLSFSRRELRNYPAYVVALAQVKKAAALANQDGGMIEKRIAQAIASACDEIVRGEHLEHFVADTLSGGGGIAVNTNINEVVANLASELLGGRRGTYQPVDPKIAVNASQSTADVCHTAARIAILSRWPELRAALRACASASEAKAREFRHVVTISRTCLQDAAPASLGDFFSAHAAVLERRIGSIGRALAALTRVNLGGTVIGDGRGAPPTYRRAVLRHLNQITGLKLTMRPNLFDAAQNIDDLAEVAVELGLLAEVLIKIAQDLRLLSSGPDGGFGEITLPAVLEGSSFFPGKINPAIPETLLQCCFQVMGCERAARLALERGELNLNVFEGAAAVNVLDAIAMLRPAIATFTERCVSGMVANEERCRELVERSRFRP